MLRLFIGEDKELESIESLRSVYDVSETEAKDFNEWLSNVTGRGNWYREVESVQVMGQAEFLELVGIESMDGLVDTELTILNNHTDITGQFISNSDDYSVIRIINR